MPYPPNFNMAAYFPNMIWNGNEIRPDSLIGFRIRRIASSGTTVDNEIIALNVVADFQIDKLFRPG